MLKTEKQTGNSRKEQIVTCRIDFNKYNQFEVKTIERKETMSAIIKSAVDAYLSK